MPNGGTGFSKDLCHMRLDVSAPYLVCIADKRHTFSSSSCLREVGILSWMTALGKLCLLGGHLSAIFFFCVNWKKRWIPTRCLHGLG